MQYSISNEDWRTTIRGLSVLQGVPLALTDEITQEMSCPYRDGDVIFAQSDMPRELFIILRGQVCIRAGGVFLVTRAVGEVFGEQAWIEATHRTAGAVAQGAAQVLAIPAATVSRLMACASLSLAATITASRVS
jgi:CRP-like cAMP-binding protein